MNDSRIKTLEQVRRFLDGSEALELAIGSQDARYAWIEQTLMRLGYRRLSVIPVKRIYIPKKTGRSVH